jgi:hypothetical protein
MITDFEIRNAYTVPETYSWDQGTPLQSVTTNTTAYLTTSYVSGYAPAVHVIVVNKSQPDLSYDLLGYYWDFGDYYNVESNTFTLSCPSLADHHYVMPGIYNISLIQKAVQTNKSLTIGENLCRGKFDIRWNWTVLESNSTEKKTWNETACTWLSEEGVPYSAWTPKWWDDEGKCYQRHCKFWSWYDLANKSDRANPIRWRDTGTSDDFEKKWQFENNDIECNNKDDFEFLETIKTFNFQEIKLGIVEVKELLPVAGLKCNPPQPFGTSPYTVTLTPFGSKPGSFPIDRIDWDLGDGTPIKTVTRFAPPTGAEFIFNNTYSNDLNDVRNYNVIHTYYRTKDTYSVFYPSITCYSANTNSWDACSTTVGPLQYPIQVEETLIKIRNTLEGNLFVFDSDQHITFLTDRPTTLTSTIKLNEPPNRLVNTSNLQADYSSYDGADYPPPFVLACRDTIAGFTETFIATEDDDPLTEPIFDGDDINDLGVPILTQRSFLIYP